MPRLLERPLCVRVLRQELGTAMKHTIHDMMQPRGTTALVPGLDCEEAANAVMAGTGWGWFWRANGLITHVPFLILTCWVPRAKHVADFAMITPTSSPPDPCLT